MKDKVRAFTRRTRGDSLERIIANLNPMLRGWYGYFKHAHGRVFQTLDALIRRRLRASSATLTFDMWHWLASVPALLLLGACTTPPTPVEAPVVEVAVRARS